MKKITCPEFTCNLEIVSRPQKSASIILMSTFIQLILEAHINLKMINFHRISLRQFINL
jgi:hypothetical protein